MNDMSSGKPSQAELARRVLKTLAERRMIPTPETFTEVYHEVSGQRPGGDALFALMKDVLRDLVRSQRMATSEAQAALQLAQARNWDALREGLEKALRRRPGGTAGGWPQMIVTLLRQADALHTNWTRARKLDAVARVVEAAGEQPDVALDRLARLLESWGPAMASLPKASEDAAGPNTAMGSPNTIAGAQNGASNAVGAAAMPVTQRYGSDPAQEEKLAAARAEAAAWQQVALRATNMLASTCVEGASAAGKLRDYARNHAGSAAREEIDKIVPQFVDAVREFDRQVDEQKRVRDGLQRLLALLTENIKTLAPEETWLVGQLEPIRALLRGPLDAQQLARAESDLTSVIARQGQARRGLAEAKVAVKELLATLIDRIGTMGDSTGRFYEQVGGYQKQLESVDDFETLSAVIKGLLADTSLVREDIATSRAELVAAKSKVDAYEQRVRDLEQELTQVSALVQKDPLTQAMNRRGLAEAFRIETARAARYESPLALAMLDLDDFKKLNDSLGHVGGDRALVHLAQIMKATLRPTDLLARLGGEEFAVLLPATEADEAVTVVERLQKELVRSAFVFEGRATALAFSAGVALWRRAEVMEELIRRADEALYGAKRAGKNRVWKAQE
jgi:diguanylate cyclase